MKTKITRKKVFETHKDVIQVGYCDLYHLLKFSEPQFYTTRPEGWGADVYSMDSTAIVTGYKPFGNVKPSSDFVKAFDNKAYEIQSENVSYESKRERVTSLLEDFLAQVTKYRA